jgi:hypothetical protein
MNTITMNGHKRPTLSEQINRLDSILDGLADNLQEAIAHAVKDAVGLAVREAVEGVLTEVLTNPALQDKLRPQTALQDGLPVPAAAAVIAQQPGWLRRLLGVAGQSSGKIAVLAGQALAKVAQMARGGRAMVSARLAGVGRRLQALARGLRTLVTGLVEVACYARKPLLIALGVGASVGLVCYLAGPLVASAVSGLAGFVGSLLASAAQALRRALLSMNLQDA